MFLKSYLLHNGTDCTCIYLYCGIIQVHFNTFWPALGLLRKIILATYVILSYLTFGCLVKVDSM